MKNLLLMRHAKSDWDDNRLSDFDRPLSERGEYDAPRMGRVLKYEDLVPDLILSSAAERARTTAELVADGCGYEKDILTTRELYMAYIDHYYEMVSALPDTLQTVLVVGHNPGIEAFLSKLIMSWQGMTTANIAQVSLPLDHWADFDEETQGDLVNFWQPKYLEF